MGGEPRFVPVGGDSLGGGSVSGAGIVGAPEPGTLAMLAASLLGLLAYAWRKQR